MELTVVTWNIAVFAELGFLNAFLVCHPPWPLPNMFHGFQREAYKPDEFLTWYTDAITFSN